MSVIGALLLSAVSSGAQEQSRELGLGFDCELRAAQKQVDPSKGFLPDTAATPVGFYIWFGRLNAARKETRGRPIPMVVDPARVLMKDGERFSATSDWPELFTFRAKAAGGTRLLTVFGDRPPEGKPGRFRAWHSLAGKPAVSRAEMRDLLVGDCAVTDQVPYTVYAAKRTVQ